LGERSGLRYFTDGDGRHLVCFPYSIENLHIMAEDLGVKRCWFHKGATYPHYDVPKRRIQEMKERCELVDGRKILAIVKGETP
jgi:hypothetical protein